MMSTNCNATQLELGYRPEPKRSIEKVTCFGLGILPRPGSVESVHFTDPTAQLSTPGWGKTRNMAYWWRGTAVASIPRNLVMTVRSPIFFPMSFPTSVENR